MVGRGAEVGQSCCWGLGNTKLDVRYSLAGAGACCRLWVCRLGQAADADGETAAAAQGKTATRSAPVAQPLRRGHHL